MNNQKRYFSKNIFDSGIIEVWFKCIGYALVTSAFAYLYITKEIKSALFIFSLSYVFTAIQVVQGTRGPYEKLKSIYVYQQSNRLFALIFEGFFLYIRLQIIISPLLVMFWAYENGKLPV
ncbi:MULTISPECIES: hypothetical protein [unclassified Pseudoalteromonas]|uniref:hypothetical protein n=1 Tax=unclassified Pseudoalteromonas TaxID=194690 RepID=UPI000567E875|nr:hypothetical protein [Pseudoalteromonas sp. A2]